MSLPMPLLLDGHDKDLGGGFRVRRLLPDARARAVGPFVFFDHFGPVTHAPGETHDVRPHPHIGLATVTYLFEGAMMHRDSLGTVQCIEPGAINWMTAGRGIVHSERRPPETQDGPLRMHGLQLWVGLPASQEECEPAFSHTPAREIPECQVDGARVRVLVGTAFGARSPVPAASETVYLDVQLSAGGTLALPPIARELAIYPVEGRVWLDDHLLPVGRMAVLVPAAGFRLRADGGARLAVIGGEPLEGRRHMWWNFVHSRPERIRDAAAAWEAGEFPQVPGETEFIPLPSRRFVMPPPQFL